MTTKRVLVNANESCVAYIEDVLDEATRRALYESPQFLPLLPALLPRAMLGVLALLLGNLFIVGINQIFDVDIDRVNKPYLPVRRLASLSAEQSFSTMCRCLLSAVCCRRIMLVYASFDGAYFHYSHQEPC